MARLQLSLLGTFRATLDGAALTAFGYDKVRALLAYLAVECDRPHHRESLAGLLWPEHPERTARLNLSQALSRLRRILDDKRADPTFIDVTRQTLQFNRASDHWLDAVAFTQALDACEKHAHEQLEGCGECLERLEGAAALYRGAFLEGFSIADSAAFEEWALLHRERLHRLAQETLHRLMQCYAAGGEYEKALPHAWRQVELDPWREAAQRDVMRLLALSGQRGAALAQYQVCCQLLEQELEAQPAPETTALYKQILAGELVVRSEDAGPPPHNLPVHTTPFVGRKAVLTELGARLEDPTCRLLTLVGPGGCGKTRLALEVAKQKLERYPDGVYFVSLAPLDSVESIVPTVADALGFNFHEAGTPQQQLFNLLRGKSLMLILDNFEHLLEGAGLVTEILRMAPGVKVLATSRARLNVGGEHRYQLTGMQVPVTDAPCREWDLVSRYGAVELFFQGARRAKQGFCLTEENISGVVQICRLAEGMPLAIRLAAPWVALLSPQEIASQLARSLDLLATDRQDVPQRQRSMRASLDYTWRLITGRDRELMQALSVFRGGFTGEAAQQVNGATLRELMALVDRALVVHFSAGRYVIHELLRQYAEAKLLEEPAEWETAHNRHSAWYGSVVEGWGEALKGAGQHSALAELRADIENVRAAWEWALERGRLMMIGQILDGLCHYYEWRGRFQQGALTCEAAAENVTSLATSASEFQVLARIWIWGSRLHLKQGNSEVAKDLLEQSLEMLDRPEFSDRDTRRERAAALCEMGLVAHNLGQRRQAERHCEQSLALYRSVGLRWDAARVLVRLGEIRWSIGRTEEGHRCYAESLAIRQSLGDRRGMADSLFGLSITAARLGKVKEGERLVRRATAIYRELGNQVGVTQGLHRLGVQFLVQGRFTEASPVLEEASATYAELGMGTSLAAAWSMLAWTKTNLGLYEKASSLYRKSQALFRELGDLHGTGYSHLGHGHMALARGAYAEAERQYQKCLAIFQTVEQRDEEGNAYAGLGLAARGQNDIICAHDHTVKALQIAVETCVLGIFLFAISDAALLFSDAGETERAVELYALVKRHPYFGASRLRHDITGKYIDAAAATLDPEVIAAAQERGRARDLRETVEELLAELETE